jgi:hypothetical protein
MTMADGTDESVPSVGIPAEEPAPAPQPAPPGPEGDGPADGAASQEDAATDAEPQRETLVDAIADLLQMFVNWLRAEASDIMREKVVLPVQQLGLTLSSAAAAGCLVVIGLAFIFVAILLVLAEWLGWPGALTLVGAVILAGAGTFTYIKMRSMQK